MKNKRSTNQSLPILLLHGWGLHKGVYADLVKELERHKHTVYALDLPGFGAEPLRKTGSKKETALLLDDYVAFVHAFLQKKRLRKVILIGHSFGGRVGVKFAYLYPQLVAHLVLTGVPVIRHRGIKQRIAGMVALIGGKMMSVFPSSLQDTAKKGLYYAIGEWDYYKAGALRETFTHIIAEDLVTYFRNLRVPVVLLWGKNDTFTPATDVNVLQSMLPNVQGIVIEGIGHRLPYKAPKQFTDALERSLS